MAACRLASRKFTFYHDRRGGITVMRSRRIGSIDSILSIQQAENVALGMTAWELEKALKCFRDQDEGNEERRCNWFSDKVSETTHSAVPLPETIRLFLQVIFSILDAFSNVAGGADGLMNLKQFATLSSFSTLSPLFTSSLFLHLGRKKMGWDNVSEKEGVMELEDYADFVLAWNDRQSPPAAKYIFKIFDRNANGYLTANDMLPFVRQCVGDSDDLCDPHLADQACACRTAEDG